MSEILAASPDPTCYHLFFGTGIEEFQSLGPDRFLPRAHACARVGRGRFAKGHSGNPRGRSPGIPNPKRRVVDLHAWRANRQGVSALLDRKPWLWRPLLAQVLPPLRPLGPAERLGIRLSSLRTPEDLRRALRKVWAALSRGEISPAEAARIARRVERAARRLAHKTGPLRPRFG